MENHSKGTQQSKDLILLLLLKSVSCDNGPLFFITIKVEGGKKFFKYPKSSLCRTEVILMAITMSLFR